MDGLIRVEHVYDGFTKYHFDGGLVLHRFFKLEEGDPHDHPWPFESTILSGSYVAAVYVFDEKEPGRWTRTIEEFSAGSRTTFPAGHIHRIIDLPDGECWTACYYGETEREPLFYDFQPDRIRTRRHWSEAWGA